jgi:hypothetical protein
MADLGGKRAGITLFDERGDSYSLPRLFGRATPWLSNIFGPEAQPPHVPWELEPGSAGCRGYGLVAAG